jgi:2-oxo-4-hydroxy-4-carboxy-5-ureidoimidazoline decarboxylase
LNAAAHVNWLNEMEPRACADAFRLCCGSDAWVRSMVAARPFVNRNDLLQKSDHIWQSLQRADWLQAFAAHPQIGSRAAQGWAAGEQAGARDADSSVFTRLSVLNREYESRFGYIFIVCATGKSAAEMLALIESRLENEPGTELHVAAEEQRKITRLRLEKLLTERPQQGAHTQRPGA